MKKIALIGSTGSIGRQTLNVVRRHPDKFKIVSLAGGNNVELLKEQIEEFSPLVATCALPLRLGGDSKVKTYNGETAYLNAVIEQADVVVVALVGFMGIHAVLKALELKKDVALANKESLVVGGKLVMDAVKKAGVNLLPIDSEHSAIWQALSQDRNKPFKRIILTASGGAFRDLSVSDLQFVTAKDALKHPNWNMGDKITVDCATMVNKGFEVIEAKWLFNADFDNIDVIIHRESIIHSMVEYLDGSTIAQMSYPSMELPIALALSYPERIDTGLKGLDFATLGKLTFAKPDQEKYPCLDLVIRAGKSGGCLPAVVNGANEVAVNMFLQGKIKFNDIYKSIAFALDGFSGSNQVSYENVCLADEYSRKAVKGLFGE
ncbi:MAG: 1-deoxy-D-xylulose-5-phosphate reductoisomerase [Clostridia bacterium]|nr:1-deoxy-D-xylulose-5-phosphate reductoisomerase [Clostridia bacterium]